MAPGKPFVGHLVNVVLYVLTGVVLFLTLCGMLPGRNPVIPFLTTLLFVAHPVHTEVVANIKSLDEILCFLFLMLSLSALIGFIDSSKFIPLIVSLFCFLCALLSKENAITWVAVVPLVLYFFTSASRKTMIVATAQFAGIALIYLLIRSAVLKGAGNAAVVTMLNNSLAAAPDGASRFATAMWIMGKYLLLLFFPHPLVHNYSYNQIGNIPLTDIRAIIPIIVYLGLIIYAVRAIRSRNGKSFGILMYLFTISLVSNIFFLIESPMAERFLYLPSLGFCLAVVIALTELLKTDTVNDFGREPMKAIHANRPLIAVMAVILILFSITTIRRNSDWKDDLTLLSRDVVNSPESALLRKNYAGILFYGAMRERDRSLRSAMLEKAISQMEKCVSIHDYSEGRFYLGTYYGADGDTVDAVKNFQRAGTLEGHTRDIRFLIDLGNTYHELKNCAEADEYYDRALQIDPGNIEVLYNYAYFLSLRGERLDHAGGMAMKALREDPRNPYLMDTYGWVLFKQKKYADAKVWIERAMNIDKGNDGLILEHYGDVLSQMGDITGAQQYWQKASEKK